MASLIQTLVLFDGPQVVLLKSDRGFNVIAVACDKAGYKYPMFAVEISDTMLRRYLEQRVDLNYVFRQKESYKKYYFFDWTRINNKSFRLTAALGEEIKSDSFYPEPGFFARDHTSDYNVNRVVSNAAKIFSIDGKWDAPDFSRFYAKIADVYAFAILSSSNLKSRLAAPDLEIMRQSIAEYAWKGGGSYRSFYVRLLDAVTSLNPLDVARIQYASPGTIEVVGGNEPLKEIDNILEIFSTRSPALKESYTALERLLEREGIKGNDKDHFITPSVERYIHKVSESFARDLGISDLDGMYDMCSGNTSIFAKVVLSYYRRGRDLYSFQAQGRVSS